MQWVVYNAAVWGTFLIQQEKIDRSFLCTFLSRVFIDFKRFLAVFMMLKFWSFLRFVIFTDFLWC